MLRLLLSALLVASATSACPDLELCSFGENCELPDCECATHQPDIPIEERPQIVYLTFDDAFTAEAEERYYRPLFDGSLVNPDNCPIRATHFVSARSMDYSLLHEYWAMGHEVASHSITHRGGDYWKNLDEEGWGDEMVGMRTMANYYGKIPVEDIKGIRAPFLQGGGDLQFNMMADYNFTYDCSMANQGSGFTNLANGIFPYTADHSSEQKCQIEPCPTCSHPGIWIQPMLDLEDSRVNEVTGDGYPCAMLDTCQVEDETKEEYYNMLMKNFERAYGGNKPPLGFYVHAAWFYGLQERYDAYFDFISEIADNDKYPDVWIVPISAGIEWRKAPITNDELLFGFFEPFTACGNLPVPDCNRRRCCYQNVDNEDFNAFQEYITTCDYCPIHYPWLKDPEGANGKDQTCSN